jgi:polyhydroxyalkanoate synthesis regulator phasin
MPHRPLLAIASNTQYSVRMRFELPTQNIRPAVERLVKALPLKAPFSALPNLPTDSVTSSITDAGHTAVGFAAMAAKKANDSRLDFNAKFESQVREARKNALAAANTVRTARNRVQTTVDPLVDRAIERLPEVVAETAAETVSEVRKSSRKLASQADRKVVELIEFVTAVPAKPVRRTPAPTATSEAPARRSTKKAPATKSPATKSPATKASAKAAPKASAKKAPVARAQKAASKTAVKAVKSTAKSTVKSARRAA